jgi:hypothetical protein
MSFNRLLYDNCEAKKYVNQSQGPGNYNMNTPIICNNCIQENPTIQMQKTGVSMNSGVQWRFYGGPVDVESDLLNMNRPLSRCPEVKYNTKNSNVGCENQGFPNGGGVVAGCNPQNKRNGDQNLVDFPSCFLQTDETRLNNPPANLRGTGINRFDPICFNPQDQVLFPGEYQTPTRLVVKDNHRPCVPTPAVNNMIPPLKKMPCTMTSPVCGNFTQPGYQYDVCG